MARVTVDRFKGLPRVCFVTGSDEDVDFYRMKFESMSGLPEATPLEKDVRRLTKVAARGLLGADAARQLPDPDADLIEILVPLSTEAMLDWNRGVRPVRIVRHDEKTMEFEIPSAKAARAVVEKRNARRNDMKERLRKHAKRPPRDSD